MAKAGRSGSPSRWHGGRLSVPADSSARRQCPARLIANQFTCDQDHGAWGAEATVLCPGQQRTLRARLHLRAGAPPGVWPQKSESGHGSQYDPLLSPGTKGPERVGAGPAGDSPTPSTSHPRVHQRHCPDPADSDGSMATARRRPHRCAAGPGSTVQIQAGNLGRPHQGQSRAFPAHALGAGLVPPSLAAPGRQQEPQSG